MDNTDYEPDMTEQWCCTCRYREWDPWFPEKICTNTHSRFCDQPVAQTDHCHLWEWDGESGVGDD